MTDGKAESEKTGKEAPKDQSANAIDADDPHKVEKLAKLGHDEDHDEATE